jgi:hypothetical protein
MSEDTSVKDPALDSSANSQAGQTAADSKATTATAPSNVPIDDYKNLQGAFTKSQQELKALREQFTTKDQEYAQTSAKAKELEEKFNRIGQAFGNAAPTETQLSPEQVAELDRLFQQTPTYRTLAEQTKAQQMVQQQSVAHQHEMAVNEAAVELTSQFKLTDEQGANLKKFILEDPALVGGIQSAATKEQALRTFRNAYKAWHYDELSKNSVALGTKQVEQNLKAMEAVTSVDQGTPTAGGAGNASIQYVKGQGLDGVWDKIAVNARQTHGIT